MEENTFTNHLQKHRLIVLMLCMMYAISSWAQKLTVESFGMIQGDLSARTYERLDANKMPCGLVKVQLAAPRATFDETGFVIGNVERRGSEYWVYMNQGSYLLQVDCPGFLPLNINLRDYGLSDGIQGKVTYKLVLVMPDTSAAPKMQKLIINYSPANAIVVVDSKTYQGNGHLELNLPIGAHDYQIIAVGYAMTEGVAKLNTEAPRIINETLQRSSSAQSIAAENTQQTNPVSAIAPTSTNPASNSATTVQTPSPINNIQPSNTPSSNGIETFTVNGVTFNMVRVDGGTFQMGSNDSDAYKDEKPVHQVTLSTYSIGETEVTQALWEAVMGSNPSKWKGSDLPVEKVSWEDCQEFITRLNQKTGRSFRLPTEAEWEFAARGGNKSRGYQYSGSNSIGEVAWYTSNSGSETHTVKTKQPNELGLYDMSGNVFEWCQDRYGKYSGKSQTNPTGPSSGSARVLRGGGWYDYARFCRSSLRSLGAPARRYNNLGLRLGL